MKPALDHPSARKPEALRHEPSTLSPELPGGRWTDTAVARASDDFYPRDPASSKPHIGACTFIGLFLSPLVQPDWDMFHRCRLCFAK